MSIHYDGFFIRDGHWKFKYRKPEWKPGTYAQVSTGIRADSRRKTAPSDVIAFRQRFLEKLNANALPNEMADWTLQQAEDWWVKEYRTPRVAPATLNSERYRLQHLRLIEGNKRLCEIADIRVFDRYVNKRLAGGIGNWSINKELTLWSMILRKAKLWDRIEDDYKPLKTQASDIGQARSRKELKHLMTVASGNENWFVAFHASVLAANTGVRGGEIKKARIRRLNVKVRYFDVTRSSTKTDGSSRPVALNEDALQAAIALLARYHAICVRENLKPDPDHFLLPKHMSRISHGAEKGARGFDPTQHQTYWDTAWKSLTIAAKLEGFRFHDLRHSYITDMVRRGIPLERIMAQVGHLSARQVRHYTHLALEVLHKDVAVLDRDSLLPKRPKKAKVVIMRKKTS